MNGQLIQTPLVKIKRSKSVHDFIVRKTLNTAWRAKICQKKIEALQKSQIEIGLVNKKQKLYNENHNFCKSLAEQRKHLLDQNQNTQNRINNLISDIQNIRRNNEKVHQDTLKIFAHTENLIADTADFKKEQGELQREVGKLGKEINSAMRILYTKENEYFDAYEKVAAIEKSVKMSKKSLEYFEGERNGFIEANKKALKEIDRIGKEIKKITKVNEIHETKYK